MNNTPLIIKREYFTRVKKKSFIIMTIVGPVLMAALFIVPVWLATTNSNEIKTVTIYDKTGKYKDAFKDSEILKFEFTDISDTEQRKKAFKASDNDAMLSISDTLSNNFVLYSEKTPDISIKENLSEQLERFLEDRNYKKLGIDKSKLDSAKVSVNIETKTLTSEGEKTSSAELPIAIGFISAFVIYMFIFMYGVQVMRGVIEEKVNRVVEILISSVKPYQLMAGKIIGIALVALTQFLLWAILTGIIVGFVYLTFGPNFMPQGQDLSQLQNMSSKQIQNLTSNNQFSDIFVAILNFDWVTMVLTFLTFFAGGYLLYASLFAAIGSAVDNETDNQQFMLPVTIPLILAIVAAQGIIKNPEGGLAFWFSIIPFTSPIIMPMRVAMGRYEIWELALSIGLLITAFLAVVWLAAKIYKVGILMYGKKVSYKELWKWLRYK